jgi:hypothetical protein
VKVLIVNKNQISKVVLPFDDLKQASQLQLRREIMELQILDLRENQIASFKQLNKYFKDTVVMLWDNSLRKQTIDQVLQKAKIFSGLEQKGDATTGGVGGQA